MKQYRELLAGAGLLYSAAIWGSTFFLVKNALSNISPLALIAFRFLIAAMLMMIFLKIKRKRLKQEMGRGFILAIILWMIYFPQTLGLKFTTASNSGFITGLFILFVPIAGWVLFRRIPDTKKILSVLLALSGLWILTGGPGEMNYGDTLTLITAVAYALHILMVGKYMKEGGDPFLMTFHQFMFVGAFSLLGALFSPGGLSWSQGSVWWIIVFLAVFPTLSAFLIQMVSQRFTSPLKVAIIFSMEPVFAALFAWTIGGERFVLHRGIGGLIIVAAILVSELPTCKKSSVLSP